MQAIFGLIMFVLAGYYALESSNHKQEAENYEKALLACEAKTPLDSIIDKIRKEREK
jgi:hypothetical protein